MPSRLSELVAQFDQLLRGADERSAGRLVRFTADEIRMMHDLRDALVEHVESLKRGGRTGGRPKKFKSDAERWAHHNAKRRVQKVSKN